MKSCHWRQPYDFSQGILLLEANSVVPTSQRMGKPPIPLCAADLRSIVDPSTPLFRQPESLPAYQTLLEENDNRQSVPKEK